MPRTMVPGYGLLLVGAKNGQADANAEFMFVVGEAYPIKDGKLGILRKKGEWSSDETVTVNVTMPAPRKLMMAGSGKIFSPGLARLTSRSRGGPAKRMIPLP